MNRFIWYQNKLLLCQIAKTAEENKKEKQQQHRFNKIFFFIYILISKVCALELIKSKKVQKKCSRIAALALQRERERGRLKQNTNKMTRKINTVKHWNATDETTLYKNCIIVFYIFVRVGFHFRKPYRKICLFFFSIGISRHLNFFFLW